MPHPEDITPQPEVSSSSASPQSQPETAIGYGSAESSSWKIDDSFASPERALTAEERWPGEWHAVAYMVAHGVSQRKIAQELNYTEAWISTILSKPAVQEKIERIRKEESLGIGKRFAGLAPHALDVFERVVKGEVFAKVETQLQASQWLLEKHTGKPKQETVVEGGASIRELLHALDQKAAAAVSAAGRPVSESAPADIELSKQKEEPKDPLAEWVSANVPGEGK